MVSTLYHDLSMMAGIRWTGTIEFYEPLPNGLPDRTRPLNLSGWHVEMKISEHEDIDPALLVLDNASNGGMVIRPLSGIVELEVTALQTALLASPLAAYYLTRVTPSLGSAYDDIATRGRLYVEPVGV